MEANYGWFRLADRLGMDLNECMEKHTDRQMSLWSVYLEEEKNWPDKVTSYLMEVAFEVRMLSERVRTLFGGKMEVPKLEQFRLRFGEPLSSVPKSAKAAAAVARAVWVSTVDSEKNPLREVRIPRSQGLQRVNETLEEYHKFLDSTEEFRGK